MKTRKFRAKKARICLNPFSPLFGVKIKPYLTAADIVAANTSCLDEFFRVDLANDTELTRYQLFENVKLAFDAVVLNNCTDLNIDGAKWEDITGSGIMDALEKKVKNYRSAWGVVAQSLELRNTYSGLNLVAQMIPNPKALDKSIADISRVIKELNSRDPEAFNLIAKTYAANAAVEIERDEFKKNILGGEKKK
jgi:hypothetical protein